MLFVHTDRNPDIAIHCDRDLDVTSTGDAGRARDKGTVEYARADPGAGLRPINRNAVP